MRVLIYFLRSVETNKNVFWSNSKLSSYDFCYFFYNLKLIYLHINVTKTIFKASLTLVASFLIP